MKYFSKKQLPVSLYVIFVFSLLLFLFATSSFNKKLVSSNSLESDAVDVNTNSFSSEEKRTPVRLKIPSIQVDLIVENVGLTSGGAMGVPKDPQNVGWFSLGVSPGNKGSAVIGGHSGYKTGVVAFDDLEKLQIGDMVYVEDNTGESVAFTVRKSRVYDAEANAPEVFESYDGGIYLNLITCVGIWEETKKSYTKRLVVFTDKTD